MPVSPTSTKFRAENPQTTARPPWDQDQRQVDPARLFPQSDLKSTQISLVPRLVGAFFAHSSEAWIKSSLTAWIVRPRKFLHHRDGLAVQCTHWGPHARKSNGHPLPQASLFTASPISGTRAGAPPETAHHSLASRVSDQPLPLGLVVPAESGRDSSDQLVEAEQS